MSELNAVSKKGEVPVSSNYVESLKNRVCYACLGEERNTVLGDLKFLVKSIHAVCK